MYENVGGKLKGLAVASMLVGIILSISIGGLFFENEDMIFIGIIIMIAGFLMSWISSLALYGFGQLVENSDKIAIGMRKKQVNNSIVLAPEDIEAQKNRLDQWLSMGAITQAEYDRKLMELWEIESNDNRK